MTHIWTMRSFHGRKVHMVVSPSQWALCGKQTTVRAWWDNPCPVTCLHCLRAMRRLVAGLESFDSDPGGPLK